MLLWARIANWTCGVLVFLVAVGFLQFLPDSIANYEREPEDVWLGVWWIAGLCFVAGLCVVNAVRARHPKSVGVPWLMDINVIVLLGLVALKAFDVVYGAYDDPALSMILYLCALGPLSVIGAAIHISYSGRHRQ